MTQTIGSDNDDPALVARVQEGLDLPFRREPGTTTLAYALEELRRFGRTREARWHRSS